MRPASRFLLSGVALVLVVVAIAAAGLLWQTHRNLQGILLHQLRRVGAVENELQANRLQELQLRADVLAHDSAFVDYVAQSLIPNPQLGGAVDSASISDLLKERRQGYDIAAVLDPRGKLVATSGILLRNPADIQRDTLVANAISTLKPVQGTWVDHGQLTWVAVNPLLRGGALQGVLLTAAHVDDEFAIAVGRIAGTGVTFAIQPVSGSAPVPSSGVDVWIVQAVASQTPAMLSLTSPQSRRLVDARNAAMTWVTPLQTIGGHAALVAVDPDAGSSDLFDGVPRSMLVGIAVLGAFGLSIVLLLWRRTWLPLQNMLDVIQRAAQTDDQHLTVRTKGSPVVRYLRDSINQLLHQERKSRE
ncbi:MAG: hypothetical protein ABI870_10825 [Rhodanobacter sp.]